jgi:hypothetical protein
VVGPRGEGKTEGFLGATIAHAHAHHAAGYPLPVKWLGATSTFQSHIDKTHDSLRSPMWKGTWQLRDSGHKAEFTINGTTLVDLRLFGVDDEKGMERLRAECHCLWFEEPAPAENISRGMSEKQWGMAISSMRLPSHANVAVATMNAPDEDDWTWQRWYVRKHPGSLLFRIPKGENPYITDAQRREWAEAIPDPVMRLRLLEGKPGTIIPGRPVAHGFNEDIHVARTHLKPQPGATLWIGQDGGLMPATVIAQRVGGRIEVLASLSSQHAGIRQHLKYVVMPWLGEHAPWVLEERERIHVCYDPTLDTDSQADSETNPLRVMMSLLPGRYRAGQNVPWSWRRDPLLAVLSQLDDGHPLLVVDPEFCKPLIKAWRGMWHYAVTVTGSVRTEEPKKPNPPWADLGDASAYLLADMAPLAPPRSNAPKEPARKAFSPYSFDRRPPTKPSWRVW